MIYHKPEDFPEEQRSLSAEFAYWEQFHPKTYKQLIQAIYDEIHKDDQLKTKVLPLDDADTDYLSEVLSNRIQSIADGYRGSQPSDDDEPSLLYLEKLLCKIQGDKALFTKIEEKGLKALEE